MIHGSGSQQAQSTTTSSFHNNFIITNTLLTSSQQQASTPPTPPPTTILPTPPLLAILMTLLAHIKRDPYTKAPSTIINTKKFQRLLFQTNYGLGGGGSGTSNNNKNNPHQHDHHHPKSNVKSPHKHHIESKFPLETLIDLNNNANSHVQQTYYHQIKSNQKMFLFDPNVIPCVGFLWLIDAASLGGLPSITPR